MVALTPLNVNDFLTAIVLPELVYVPSSSITSPAFALSTAVWISVNVLPDGTTVAVNGSTSLVCSKLVSSYEADKYSLFSTSNKLSELLSDTSSKSEACEAEAKPIVSITSTSIKTKKHLSFNIIFHLFEILN